MPGDNKLSCIKGWCVMTNFMTCPFHPQRSGMNFKILLDVPLRYQWTTVFWAQKQKKKKHSNAFKQVFDKLAAGLKFKIILVLWDCFSIILFITLGICLFSCLCEDLLSHTEFESRVTVASHISVWEAQLRPLRNPSHRVLIKRREELPVQIQTAVWVPGFFSPECILTWMDFPVLLLCLHLSAIIYWRLLSDW